MVYGSENEKNLLEWEGMKLEKQLCENIFINDHNLLTPIKLKFPP